MGKAACAFPHKCINPYKHQDQSGLSTCRPPARTHFVASCQSPDAYTLHVHPRNAVAPKGTHAPKLDKGTWSARTKLPTERGTEAAEAREATARCTQGSCVSQRSADVTAYAFATPCPRQSTSLDQATQAHLPSTPLERAGRGGELVGWEPNCREVAAMPPVTPSVCVGGSAKGRGSPGRASLGARGPRRTSQLRLKASPRGGELPG